jgi:hypothetical protein
MKIPARTAAVALLTLALAACGAPAENKDVATAGGKPKTGSSSSKNANLTEKLRKYAKCMRENGVDMPDPGPDGTLTGSGTGTAVEPGSKEEKAFEKCREYEPQGDDLPEPKPEDLKVMREYAKCMRDNGVSQFPDPGTGDSLVIGKDGKDGKDGENGAIDPSSPTYAKASKACEKILGKNGGPAGIGTTG